MTARSIRPFIGSKQFDTSRAFYLRWGFGESRISKNMSLFHLDKTAFYLQDAYVKKWVDNTMLFLEVEDIDSHHQTTLTLQLPNAFKGVRVSEIQHLDWGKEYFVHDPSGILWHVGSFKET